MFLKKKKEKLILTSRAKRMSKGKTPYDKAAEAKEKYSPVPYLGARDQGVPILCTPVSEILKTLLTKTPQPSSFRFRVSLLFIPFAALNFTYD